MAKAPTNSAAQRVRKKVRKNIADGIAHVHASFNTPSSPSPTAKAMHCHGHRRVVKVSRAHASPLHLQRKLRLK
jgi:ribosomal protein S11